MASAMGSERLASLTRSPTQLHFLPFLIKSLGPLCCLLLGSPHLVICGLDKKGQQSIVSQRKKKAPGIFLAPVPTQRHQDCQGLGSKYCPTGQRLRSLSHPSASRATSCLASAMHATGDADASSTVLLKEVLLTLAAASVSTAKAWESWWKSSATTREARGQDKMELDSDDPVLPRGNTPKKPVSVHAGRQ